MRWGFVIVAILTIVSVQAGVLVVDTTIESGTLISATWLQGAEKVTVRYTDGSIYRSNMTLISGPNRCFIYGADGNDRAIVIEPQSDDRGPERDATVDCNVCGCEETSGTRFTCTQSGACVACDPCDSDTCSAGEVCIRESCAEARCACDPIQCGADVCDGRRSTSGSCEQNTCIRESSCIQGRCGAECSEGDETVRTVCVGSELYRESSTCSESCSIASERSFVVDCAERDCAPGRAPTCSAGGCVCL